MVDITAPNEVGPFHRGFAHLALRYQSMAADPSVKDFKDCPDCYRGARRKTAGHSALSAAELV